MLSSSSAPRSFIRVLSSASSTPSCCATSSTFLTRMLPTCSAIPSRPQIVACNNHTATSSSSSRIESLPYPPLPPLNSSARRIAKISATRRQDAATTTPTNFIAPSQQHPHLADLLLRDSFSFLTPLKGISGAVAVQSDASEEVPSAPASSKEESAPSDTNLELASMSVFARMEAQMRQKKKQQAELETTTAQPVASSAAAAEATSTVGISAPAAGPMRWTMKFPLQKPNEPKLGECCGRDCQNCVWIQYSNALEEYEAEQRAMQLQSEAEHYIQAAKPKFDDASSDESHIDPSSSSIPPVIVPPSPLASIPPSSRPLNRFEKAMEREREMLGRILPAGPGNRRQLGAIIRPHSSRNDDDHTASK